VTLESLVLVLATLGGNDSCLPGMLKAVPLCLSDPAYPEARRNLMLEDVGEGVLVTHSSLAPSFQSAQSTRIVIAEDGAEASSGAKRTAAKWRNRQTSGM